MTPVFERLAVLGLGLLGGSVALAARRAGVAARVVGAARRPEVRRQVLASGAVDEVADFPEAARGADLVVLATPVAAMPELVRAIAPGLGDGALVTDVGSVKARLDETLPGLLPRGVVYVGAHPMAGSHERGFEHARADLFQGAPCVVSAGADAPALERVCGFWRALGARVVVRVPSDHDVEVAWASHVPHALAFGFARAFGAAPAGAREVAGSGFRDFTRIARSDSEMWADILVANRKAIAGPLQAVAAAVCELSRAIEANDSEAVERWIAGARTALDNPQEPGDPERAPGQGDRTGTHE